MNPSNPLILPFSDIRATDLPLVGGKGANLGEMTYASFPIPPGFCLTTAAFQQFIDASPASGNIYKKLDEIKTNDVEIVRKVGSQIRETLSKVPIPQAVSEAIQEKWRQMGSDHAYAVRSSATAEDLPDASFAGQQDTYLNVIGETELLDAVRNCWISLFTDRAILYRTQNKFDHRKVQLSVVVQQMIMSEKSGILFTADPLSGHRHTLTIDASFGLGEALVSGLVSPDAYRVDKRDGTIIDRQIADKQVAIYPEKDGGVRQENLSDAQRAQTVLTDAQILELADMGKRVGDFYGSAQDIEWALVGDRFYLLQSRPITSLYPIDDLPSSDDELRIYFSMGHQQNMTNAMSPLSVSSMRCVTSAVGVVENGIESSFMLANGGHIFMDLTTPLRHPILSRVLSKGLSQFDALAPEAFRLAMQRPEFQRPHRLKISFSTIKGILGVVFQILHTLWRKDVTGFVNKTDELIDAYLSEVEARLDGLPAGKEQVAAIIAFLSTVYQVVLNWAFQFVAGEVARRMIMRLARNWATPAELDGINLGLTGNVVTDMNLAIGDLADLARKSPRLTALFQELDDDSLAWFVRVAEIEDSADFLLAWQAFLDQYGARGSAEIDIRAPHWYEEPLPLLQVIASSLQTEAGNHRKHHKKSIREREATVEKILTAASKGIVGGVRVRLLKRLVTVMYECGVLREHHKFMVVRALRFVKEKLKIIADELTSAQKLTEPDDVWFLTWPELLTIWDEDAPDYASLMPARHEKLARFQEFTPPLMVTSDGETPFVKYTVADAPPGALLGNPVSPGMVEGIVRVIHDPQAEMLNPGEILVAPFTDPGWTPLFINAGGLIMEVGGVMNHGSIVAREYGIPAIVGVRDATQALQTGQRVRVDGNRGIIEIL